MHIKSNIIPNAYWDIRTEIMYSATGNRLLKHDKEIVGEESRFVANYNPVVLSNDLTGEEWCFDTKLPSGGWLENIKPSWDKNGARVYRALVLI